METKQELVVGKVKEIRRFPVKSLSGESLSSVTVDQRGLLGDRLWAVRHQDGKFGSGKTTRRFKRTDGLQGLEARYEGTIPVVTMPDGNIYRGDDEAVHSALSRFAKCPVTLAREETVSHFDEGPVSIITTSSLRALSERLGESIDSRRFRANFLIDTEAEGFIEDEWVNGVIQIGPDIKLRVVAPLIRCVMVNFAHQDLRENDRILRTLASNHDALFGVFARVENGGRVEIGHTASFFR